MIDYKAKEILFIDFDGTLVDTATGATFPAGITDVKIRHEVVMALIELAKKTDLKWLCVVTNQGGIESGHYSFSGVFNKLQNICFLILFAINEELAKLEKPRIKITIEACTVNDKNNPNRKPNIGLLKQSVQDIRETDKETPITLGNMFMIGDASGKPGDFSDSDLQCAKNAEIDYVDVEQFVKDMQEFEPTTED